MERAGEETQRRSPRHGRMGAYALLSVLFAFVAVVVAGQAFSRSNDVESAVAEASGTPVSLSGTQDRPFRGNAGRSRWVSHGDERGNLAHNLDINGTNLKTADIAPGAVDTLDLSSRARQVHDLLRRSPGTGAGMTAMLHVGRRCARAAAALTGGVRERRGRRA